MGHFNWACTWVSAAAGLTAFAAGPAEAAADCFPRAAAAAYSTGLPASSPAPAMLRAPGGARLISAPARPVFAIAHQTRWAHPGAPHRHRIAHSRSGAWPAPHRRLAANTAPAALGSLPGVDASATMPLGGLFPVGAPAEACAPLAARPAILAGPAIVAAAPSAGWLADLIGPAGSPETAPTVTGVDAAAVEVGPGEGLPVGWTDQAPQIVGVVPGAPSLVTPTGSGVPEPSSWALMLLGLFGAGGALRRAPRRSVNPA